MNETAIEAGPPRLRRAAFFGLFFLAWMGCNGAPGVKQFGDGASTVIRTDAADDARDAKVMTQEAGNREAGDTADAGGDASADATVPGDGGLADGGPCAGAEDGTACDDGDKCTLRDTCQGGRCLGENPVVCSAADACHKAGICRPDTGACDSPNEDDGKACDDGDKCTHDDVCKSGVCGGAAVVCLASDQCHQEGTCDPATGACASPAKAEGASCDDANKCTHDDVCKSGVCGGVAVVCPAGDQCHTTGVCDAATGSCSNPAKADGVSCDDQDTCTRTDACQAGACKGGNLPGCMSSPTCKAKGECVEVSDCTGQADGTLCDDGNACTQRDICMGGACLGGSPVVCKAADACHDAGACNSQTGACTNPVKANGTTCEDGNACTGGDACQNGSCVAGAAKTCAATDTCHAAGTCNPATGTCSNPIKANGAGCSDGNACTQTDVCMQGVCMGSNAKVCAASDQCHDAGTCTPATGVCTNPATRNGKVCDDKNACTSNESCQNGVCGGGTSLTCPAVACQVAGACAPATGQCSYTAAPNGTSCTDTDFCTTNESCVGGKCTAGGAVSCNDRLPCQSGQCSSAQRACVYTNVDGMSCSDGNACTGGDTCRGGTCRRFGGKFG